MKQTDTYKKIVSEFQRLERQLQDPETINNTQKLQQISQRHAALNEVAQLAQKYLKNTKEISSNEQLIHTEKSKEIIELAESEITELTKENKNITKKIKKLTLESDPNNKRNAIIEIRAGTGGEEAALFAADLFRMYQKYSESNNWTTQILSTNITGNGGFKEIIARIEGQGAYGKLKYENGVHRVQRIPTTESSGRIHTSAASVVVLPEVDDIPDIEIHDQDIKVDVYRAGGPGGQSVNTTDSAVRITHLPTKIVITCQDEKSQHKNKARALSILKSKLYEIQQEELAKETDKERKNAIKTGDRSAKIKTYNFPQGRITDHRTKQTWHNLTNALDGDIDTILSETIQKLRDGNETN